MRSARSCVAVVVVLVATMPSILAAADGSGMAREVIHQISSSRPMADRAVAAPGFRLNTGLGWVYLEDGILVPSSPIAGRPVEYAFVGTGRVVMHLEDEVEAGQLEVFTGSRMIDEPFSRAVFVVALDAASDALEQLPPATDDSRLSSAVELLGRWRSSPERRLIDVEARMLRDGVGDPLGRGFFCAAVEGEVLGRFLWVVDPLAEEQLTIGQFVQPELTDREIRRAERHLQREQRQGKLMGRQVSDLGIWNTWVSASLADAAGDPTPGTPGIESRHYAIEAELEGKRLEMTARAHVEFEVLVDGLRVVTLDMDGDLIPIGVTNEEGDVLPYFRSHDELTVVLLRPCGAGEQRTLTVEYTGRPLDRLASGAYSHRRPLGWYPHAGGIDRATYQLEIRWPKKYQLFGSGSVVDEGVEGRTRWQRRTLDVPAIGFSFEVGDFEVATGSLGGTEITVAIDRLGQNVSPDLAEEVLEAIRGPLAYFQAVYGPYPLDRLTVVSSPRSFSQGLLGFVTLSTAGIVDWDIWTELLGFEDRRLLIAHELAHQWWGNLVGWRSYRDQWISEAMANYSALLYERNRLRIPGEENVGPGPTAGWRASLERRIPDGRPVESLGPVVMGVRLNSSLSRDAYHAIVYLKGAVVLDMLARLYGEGGFLTILADVVDLAGGRVLTTDGFLTALERLGGTDLGWFRSQYIYGTGMPEIAYRYTIDELGDGRWRVAGEAEQQPSYQAAFGVVRRPDGRLDVVRSNTARLDVTDSVLVVPFQIGIAIDQSSDAAMRGATGVPQRLLTGRIVLEGERTPFQLDLQEEARVLWLDRFGEVFGRFTAVDRWPRHAALNEGLKLLAEGEVERAEEVLESALSLPVFNGDEAWFGYEIDADRAAGVVDTGIHLGLARIYLDADRLGEAAEQLEAARQTVTRGDRWRFEGQMEALEARWLLLSGRPEAAQRQLRRSLNGRSSMESAEGWALLAVASHVADRTKDYQRACRHALERGVDLGPLECP